MIAKTFKGGRTGKGAKATLDYLLNERVDEGTAKLLRGDRYITQELINYASKKQKWSWSSGVLSFEEHIKDRKIIESIMNDFEYTFFAGIEQDNYNILWVLHEDKGRTELHYVAPRIELSTGLSFNTYFVKRDFAKKDLFQEYINLKYDLSSFKDSRKVMPQPPKWRNKAKKEDIRKRFDDALMPLVKDEIITSREEVIYQLQEWGYDLNREGKSYISVIDEQGKTHRLKGVIYAEDFTSWGAVERKIKTEARTVTNGVSRELEALREELEKIIRSQSFTNRERVEKKLQRLDKRARTEQCKEVYGGVSKVEKTTAHSSPYRPYPWFDGGNIGNNLLSPKLHHRHEKVESGKGQFESDDITTKEQLEHKKGEVNDRVGTEAIRRVRVIRERARARAREAKKAQRRVLAEYQAVIEQHGIQISKELDRADEQRGQRAKELNSVLADAYVPKQADYRAIKAATTERGNIRTVGQNINTLINKIRASIDGLARSLKQEFSRRTQNITIGVCNVIKKRRLFDKGRQAVMFKIRHKKIRLKPRR